MKCRDEKLIASLVEINKRAGAEPEIIDLIAAYARLCLKDERELSFYKDNSAPAIPPTSKISVRKFIEKNPHLDKRSLSFLASYAEIMRDSKLPFIFSITHLADFLDTKEIDLRKLIKNKDISYRKFYIPKSNGGRRLIAEPVEQLKSIQRSVLGSILERVPLHSAANGFRRQKSIVTNAEKHTEQEIIVKIDLKDFFPSITYQRVKGVYMNLGYPEGVAEMLAELSTYNGKLPMGAPTSPYLSNIIAIRMDKRFTKLGEKIGFRYSRYADDLAFSSSDRNFTKRIPFFRKIIEDEGFIVNEKKIAIARKGGRQKITGVVINKKVNIDSKEYKKLRAVVHNCINGDLRVEMKKWGASSLYEFRNILTGKIGFVKMLNWEKGDKLFERFRQISWPV